MTKAEDILNDLESLTALFKDYNDVSKMKKKLTIPMECLRKVVFEKLDRIKELTKEL